MPLLKEVKQLNLRKFYRFLTLLFLALCCYSLVMIATAQLQLCVV